MPNSLTEKTELERQGSNGLHKTADSRLPPTPGPKGNLGGGLGGAVTHLENHVRKEVKMHKSRKD